MSSRTIIDYHAPFDRGFTVLSDSRKYPYSPTEGHWKFLGGGGLKSQTFRRKVIKKLNWNFLGGERV